MYLRTQPCLFGLITMGNLSCAASGLCAAEKDESYLVNALPNSFHIVQFTLSSAPTVGVAAGLHDARTFVQKSYGLSLGILRVLRPLIYPVLHSKLHIVLANCKTLFLFACLSDLWRAIFLGDTV